MTIMPVLNSLLLAAAGVLAAGDPIAPPAGGVADGTEYVVRQLLVRSDQVVLAGELLIPHASEPVPAVLLVTGSGPHTREQTISGCPMFRMIAEDLVSRGLAACIVDARAYGLSSGAEDFTTADRAKDARACLERLRSEHGLDPERIGVLGHSEGAMIALMLASEPHPPAFAVLLGSPGVPCGELWVDQATSGLAARGVEAATVAKVRAAFLKAVAMAARGFASDAEYEAAGREVLLAHGVAPEDVNRAFIDRVMSDLRTPWHRCFLGWDPAAYLPRVQAPLLALWGERDLEVPPSKNAALFEAERRARPELDLTSEVLPDEDHFFLRNPAGQSLTEHEYGRMHVSPALLDAVAEWIQARTSPATPPR